MSNQVQVKRSAVPGKQPTLVQLPAGSMAMNTADRRMFFSTGDLIKLLANVDDLTWANLGGKPNTLAGFGINDAAPLSHVTDDSRHVTAAQNAWIDAITASATEVNYLAGVTSSIQSQLDSKQASLGFTPENAANKGVANGYCPLDATIKIPSTYLPSYVDDVIEGANLAAFPATGETGKMYVALDTNKVYRWSGSVYVEISGSPGSTDAVPEGSINKYYTAARAQADVTSVTGNAGTATKLQTARTLSVSGPASGSTTFDGSANATIALVLANDLSLPGTGGVKVPVGGTAQRIAENGRFRLNTDTGAYEGYYNGTWSSVTPLTLSNGFPAHYESVGNNLVSIDSVTYLFNTKTNGNRNIYLSIAGDIASNVNGYAIPMNALLYSVTIQIGAAVGSAMTFEIRKNPTGTLLTSFTMPAGATTVHVNNIAALINSGEELSCYINSPVNVANPLAVIRIKWRN